jgi:hypothetical protein
MQTVVPALSFPRGQTDFQTPGLLSFTDSLTREETGTPYLLETLYLPSPLPSVCSGQLRSRWALLVALCGHRDHLLTLLKTQMSEYNVNFGQGQDTGCVSSAIRKNSLPTSPQESRRVDLK